MSICLYLDPASCRRWHWTLLDMVEKEGHGPLAIAFSKPSVMPERIRRHYRAEKSLFLGNVEIGGDPVDQQDFLAKISPDIRSVGSLERDFDLVIDLVGDGSGPSGKKTITLLFNGHPGDKALISSILSDGMPQIAFRTSDGEIVATALPSGELATALPGAMDQTFCRVVTLLRALLNHPDRWADPLIDKQPRWPGMVAAMRTTVSLLARKAIMAIYARLFRPNHWHIGWRHVGEGNSWTRQSLEGEAWQILKDRDNRSYADPAICSRQGKHFLFFEDLDAPTGKGVISVVEFDDNGPVGEAQVCLEEDYHLSYPFLWEEGGEILMIPETSNNRDVAIYRAKDFPFGWEREKVLLSNIDAADVTITQYDGKYWLFCVTRDGDNGYSDCLSIFHADDLYGPWHPHAQNPVLIDAATARPAGAFYQEGGKLYRPVQDCTHHYGAEIALVEVTHLSGTDYRQKVIGRLAPGKAWPGRKLHTLNHAGNLEVIDGAILRPRLQPLQGLFSRIFAPVGD